MYKRFITILVFCLLHGAFCRAQTESDTAIKNYLKTQIAKLADTSMHGRGYVKGGRQDAARYIRKQFKKYHLRRMGPQKGVAINMPYPGKAHARSYVQTYTFPVNIFPGLMEVSIDGKKLKAGKDYIVDAGSTSFSASHLTFEQVDLASIKDKEQWRRTLATFRNNNKAYYLENIDSVCKLLGLKKHHFSMVLPVGCYIIPQKEKFIWTVNQETTHATVIYVKDTLLKGQKHDVSVHIKAELIKAAPSENIVGYLRGDVKDTFIAITAHYDHLGMMGSDAIFPGASDNASGTAMLLYMAKYFSTHQHHYSILFIAFSGEEAGLVGSEYFTKHPLVPLSNLKFLTNMDIMGDATDGITVVNATEYPKQFELLQRINTEQGLLPQIKSRGKAANSDHYHFSEAGVPSFFIYSNGGKGYYHDIDDKAAEISLNHIDGTVTLVINFLKELK